MNPLSQFFSEGAFTFAAEITVVDDNAASLSVDQAASTQARTKAIFRPKPVRSERKVPRRQPTPPPSGACRWGESKSPSSVSQNSAPRKPSRSFSSHADDSSMEKKCPLSTSNRLPMGLETPVSIPIMVAASA